MFDAIVAPLLITLVSELAVGWWFGFRNANEVLAIFGVNIVTNPVLNYGVRAAVRAGFMFSLPIVLLMELTVVLVEAGLLIVTLPTVQKRKLALFSFSANLTSFLAGALLL